MKRRRPVQARTLFRSQIALEAVAAEGEQKNPRWIQIARTGLWKGYRMGRTIEFTADTFRKLIENFRAHPSYAKGADGVGNADVIPWDFNHASEMDPTEGTLPVVGAPAQAWVQELEMRAGADGKTGLWAFTHLLEPVLTYISEKKIKWASVTVWPNAIDPVSGKEVGPLLTSVAFTNQPFIEGMEPIAASYGPGGYYDRAQDAEDALRQLRGCFGLPQTTGVADVMAEIGKLRSWVESGTVPFGVDVDGLVGAMRTILALPALAAPGDVFAEANKLLVALVEQEALEAAETGPNLPTQNASATVSSDGTPAGLTQKRDDMDVKILATAFGIVATTEEAILAAAKDAAHARTQLTALHRAIGVTDQDGAVTTIADLFAKSKELAKLKPDYDKLTARVAEIDAATTRTEVLLAMEEHGLPESLEEVLIDFCARKPEEFRKKYPITPADKKHLTRSVFASHEGGEFGSEKTGAGGGTGLSNRQSKDVAINLDAYPGRNRIEKCMSFVRATVPGADKWPFEQVHEQACELNKSLTAPARA